jgi:hypothetical protein
VGINTTAPGAGLALDVNGQVGISSNPAVLSLLGSQLRDQGDGILRIRSGGAIVTFDGSDNVGIGTTTPSELLEVNGNALIGGNLTLNGFFFNFSDARLKQDIQPIAGALGRLLALRGVEFEWSRPDLARLRPGPQVGMIADEVEQVFPAWVAADPKTGLKMLSPQGFEGVAVEAMREISQRVEGLEADVRTLDELRGQIDALLTQNQVLHKLVARVDALEHENRALHAQLARKPPPDDPPPNDKPPRATRHPRAKQ